jgi:hypothetical protein
VLGYIAGLPLRNCPTGAIVHPVGSTRRYFDMRYTVNLALYKTVKQEIAEIPFHQRDVHVYNKG